MSKDRDVEETYVVFRKEKEGDIVAVMPYPSTTMPGSLVVYQHVGQHSEGHIAWYHGTHPAKPGEYARLKKELEGLGYRLKVRRRLPSWSIMERMRQDAARCWRA